jgi:hypothetical protein
MKVLKANAHTYTHTSGKLENKTRTKNKSKRTKNIMTTTAKINTKTPPIFPPLYRYKLKVTPGVDTFYGFQMSHPLVSRVMVEVQVRCV